MNLPFLQKISTKHQCSVMRRGGVITCLTFGDKNAGLQDGTQCPLCRYIEMKRYVYIYMYIYICVCVYI